MNYLCVTKNLKASITVIKATAAALFSFLCLSLIGITAKIAIKSTSSSVIWILFLQCGTAFLFALFFILKGGLSKLKTKKLHLHLLRALCGLFSFLCFLIALMKIPLVDASLLQNSSPLFIPIISFVWLKTAIDGSVWWAIGVGLIGIIFIIKPDTGMLFKSGDLAGLASGIILALGYVTMKLLTETESFVTILFYFTMITFICSMPFALLSKPYPHLHTIELSALCGIFLILFLYSIRYAYTMADPVKLAPLVFSVVVFTGIFDWLLFRNIPDAYTVIGIIFVILGGILSISFHERGKKPVTHTWH